MAWNEELTEREGDTLEIYFGGTLLYEIKILMLAVKLLESIDSQV